MTHTQTVEAMLKKGVKPSPDMIANFLREMYAEHPSLKDMFDRELRRMAWRSGRKRR